MSKKSDPTTRSKKMTPSAAERPAAPAEAVNALEQLMPRIQAYPETNIRRINFDVPRGVSIAAAAHARIKALRGEILAAAPKTPADYIDNLPTYAMAAWYAYLAALPTPTASLDALKAEAGKLRGDMLVAAEALAYKGFFDKGAVAKIKEGSGFIDLASDTVALSALFTQNWEDVQNKTFVEWSEVERASVVGPELLVALGEKLGYGATTSEKERIRNRAVSLFVDVYDELLRAVSYLRWHEDDARTILPTIHTPRGKAKTASADETDDVVPGETPAPVATVTPVTPPTA